MGRTYVPVEEGESKIHARFKCVHSAKEDPVEEKFAELENNFDKIDFFGAHCTGDHDRELK